MDSLQTWTSLAKLGDIPDGVTAFKKKRKNVAVFKKNGEIKRIFEDNCPHNKRIKISDDYIVDGDTITCSFHGACWKLQDGEIVRGPGREGLLIYNFRIDPDGLVEILI